MKLDLTVALLAEAIASAFAIGAILLLILTILPRTRAVTLHLWPIFGTEAAILALGVIPWLLPRMALLGFLLLAAARIGFESGTVHGLTTGRPTSATYAAMLVLAGGLSWSASTPVFLWFAAVLVVAALTAIRLTNFKSVLGSAARFAVFPLLPFAAFSHAASNSNLAPVLVLAFFLVEMFDSFSLLGGRLYGRTALVPRLSPRKTWEGLATGFSATALAAIALGAWLEQPLTPYLVTAIIVMIAAFIGDLMGSLSKRRAGVKDYPAVMTLQGGLLDIVDSWLVAGPALAALIVVLGWI